MQPVLSYGEFDQCVDYERHLHAHHHGKGPDLGIPPECFVDYLHMDKATANRYRSPSGNHSAQPINLMNVSMPAETFKTLINMIKNVTPNPINPSYQQSNRFAP